MLKKVGAASEQSFRIACSDVFVGWVSRSSDSCLFSGAAWDMASRWASTMTVRPRQGLRWKQQRRECMTMCVFASIIESFLWRVPELVRLGAVAVPLGCWTCSYGDHLIVIPAVASACPSLGYISERLRHGMIQSNDDIERLFLVHMGFREHNLLLLLDRRRAALCRS